MANSLQPALLVLSHGAAEVMAEVPAYYAHILHGRTPRPERLRALEQRYVAIGGASPLNHLTRTQAQQIASVLRAAGSPMRPYVGFQHTPPFIADVVRDMAADGVGEAVVLVMTAYYSPLGTGHYLAEARRAAEAAGTGLQLHCIESWDGEPEFLDLLTGRVQDGLSRAAHAGEGPYHVIFTAHSLPVLRSNLDDPYVARFQAATRAVAARLGLERWSTCYQSASDTGQPWLSPDILDEVRRVGGTGAKQVVACPSSFAADNLEVLYDVGIDAARVARELGMGFVRTRPFNDDPAFTAFLARVVARRWERRDAAAEVAAVAHRAHHTAPTAERAGFRTGSLAATGD